MPNVRMPDGTVVGFPDDMPHDQIKGLISQKFPQAASPDQGGNWLQRTISNIPESAKAVGESMLHPERDIETAWALGKRIKKRLEEADSGQRPISVTHELGRLGGAIAGGIQNLPTTIEKDPVGSAVNLGLMAVSPEGVAGRALGIAGKAPEAGKFLDAGAKALEEAKGSLQQFPREALPPRLDALKAELKANDYDPRDHPLIAKALKRIEKDLAPAQGKSTKTMAQMAQMASSVKSKMLAKYPDLVATIAAPSQTHTFRDLVKVRKSQAIKDARKSANETEGNLAHIIMDHLDDYENSLGEIGGVSKEGRALYSRGKKLEKLQDLEERARRRARRQHYGLPHARSLEFEKIAGSKTRLRTWTPEEQERIIRAAAGGDTTQWLANKVGRLALRGPMSGAIDVVLGSMLPLRGAELATAGEVGRVVERVKSTKGLRELKNLVAVGGNEESLARFATTIGPKVAEDLAGTPAGKRAIQAFINKPTPASARVVALVLARRVNRPDLAPRIQQELENMDQDNNGRSTSLTPAVAPTR